jgi:hypothetical protein
MGQLILAAVAGGLILLFIATTLIYRGLVKGAEAERDEAVTLAAQAMEAKTAAEEGFAQIKKVFEERMKLPIQAIMTDEQVDNIAKYLASRLLTANQITSIKAS